MTKKIKAGIIGANGYTGVELLRLLTIHPNIEIKLITSQSQESKKLTDLYPQFQGIFEAEFKNLEAAKSEELDILFLALPHGASMSFVKDYKGPAKIIDLSADFRLKDVDTFIQWYKSEHQAPGFCEEFVYGLTELNRDKVQKAKYIANPGCYPTASILALAPLVKHSLITDTIIIDAKSGTTGAGAKPSDKTHFAKVNDNFNSYGVKTHRHTPEIEQSLNELSDINFTVQFTPHLLPVSRGIYATVYAKAKKAVVEKDLFEIFNSFYSEDKFIRVVETIPTLKDVTTTNFCSIYPTYDERTGNIIVISVIDNLVKGAAGQAIQNMNLMFNLEETTGLIQVPVSI